MNRAVHFSMSFFLCIYAHAQTSQGGISGNVTDASGGSVAGAKVVAQNPNTGIRQETISSEGGFRFPSLPVGLYDVSVQREGFSTVTRTGIQVEIGSLTSVNISLAVGTASQTVTIAAEAPGLRQDTSDIGTVINTRQVTELPLALGGVGAMRSPEAFKFLAPGTTGPGTGNNSNGIFISKVNGGQNFGNEILLDGASILRTENGSSFDEAAPSVEAIQEFKSFTSTFSAQYDRTTGGIDSFTTKSGANTYHGTMFDIFRNTALNENSWFNAGYLAKCALDDQRCQYTYRRSPDHKNDYGLNLGGPVSIPKIYNGRNRTFFFFNWEQYLQTVGATNVSTVPTLAMRNGDFSQLLTNTSLGTNPCDNTTVFAGQIFDPATQRIGASGLPCRTAFPGNIVPASRISSVARTVLGYLPEPTSPGLTQNYALFDSNPLANTVWTLRMDHNFSENSRIFAMYSGRDNTRRTSSGRGYPSPIDSLGWNQDFITKYARAGWDYTITPTLLSHLNIGFNRTDSLNYTDGAIMGRAQNIDWDAKLGIKGASGDNFPNFNFGEGIRTISRGNDDDEIDNGWRFNENIMWIKGRHSLMFGVDVRTQLYSTIRQSTQSGNFNFGRAQTAATQALGATSGNGFASFLLGAVGSGSRYLLSHYPRWISQYYAGFVQDDFKVSKTLTLNLGLRYNLEMPRRESFNNTSNFSPDTPNPGAANRPGALVFGTNCNCNTRWVETYKKAFSPRFGFAWSPSALDSKTVFRGGAGVFYGPLQYTDSGSQTITGYLANPNFTNLDNFSPGFSFDAGFPAYPDPPITDPAYVNGQSPYWLLPGAGRPSSTYSWSFQIQQKLASNLIGTVGYVAQSSTHLRSNLLNPNNLSTAYFGLGDALNAPIGSALAQQNGVNAPYAGFAGNVAQALRPFPQFSRINTSVMENAGHTSYHSLQATAEQRFHAGLTLQASFTWSKTLTNADSLIPQTNAGVSGNQTPYDLRLEKALSIQDVPLTFVAAWLYELPFGRGRQFLTNNFASAIVGGWQLGGVQRYQSGEPVSFGCANNIPGWDNCVRFSRVSGQQIFSDQVHNGSFDPFVNSYYNRAAFVDPNANRRGGAYQLGDYPRVNGDARMKPYFNEDFSVIRNFKVPIHESLRLQFKAEILNAFNRHIFAAPNTTPTSPTFGLVTGTINGPRNVQFTLRLNF